MPIYEFECPVHGIFERLMSLSKSDVKEIICDFDYGDDENYCEQIAQKVFSIPVTRFEAAPTIIFKNPRTGEFQVATHRNDKPPVGYIKEELRGPIERSKFEKEVSTRKYVEDELTTEKLKQGREQTAKNIHDDIKSRMNSVTNKVYNPDTKQEENVVWDSETKALLKRSMEYTHKKHAKIKPKRTDVRLEVNHTDSSNLVK